MDIKNISNTATRLPLGKTANRSGKAAVTDTDPASSSTQVSLSSASQAMLAASVGDGGQVFDAGKVEQIKSAIASGQFQVDSSKVADSLLQSVRSLLGQGTA